MNLCSSAGKRNPFTASGTGYQVFFFGCVVYCTVDYNICVFGIEVDCFYIDVIFFVFIGKIPPRAQKLFSE